MGDPLSDEGVVCQQMSARLAKIVIRFNPLGEQLPNPALVDLRILSA
jgi:hypothetical protein